MSDETPQPAGRNVKVQVDEAKLAELAHVILMDFRDMQGKSEAEAVRNAVHAVLRVALPEMAKQLLAQLGYQYGRITHDGKTVDEGGNP